MPHLDMFQPDRVHGSVHSAQVSFKVRQESFNGTSLGNFTSSPTPTEGSSGTVPAEPTALPTLAAPKLAVPIRVNVTHPSGLLEKSGFAALHFDSGTSMGTLHGGEVKFNVGDWASSPSSYVKVYACESNAWQQVSDGPGFCTTMIFVGYARPGQTLASPYPYLLVELVTMSGGEAFFPIEFSLVRSRLLIQALCIPLTLWPPCGMLGVRCPGS